MTVLEIVLIGISILVLAGLILAAIWKRMSDPLPSRTVTPDEVLQSHSKPASKKDTLETFTPTGVNLDFIAELLNGVARAQNPTSYLDAMRTRAQARRQIQQVKLIEEYSATMVSILNNTKEAQAAFLEMAILFIDAKYVPLIHEKVRQNQQKLADAGKDPYASSPQTEQSQEQPGPEYIRVGREPRDPK